MNSIEKIEELEKFGLEIEKQTSNQWIAENGYGLDDDGNYPEVF